MSLKCSLVRAYNSGMRTAGDFLARPSDNVASIGKGNGNVALLSKTHPAPEGRLTNLGEAIGDRFDAINNGRTLAERFNGIKLAKGTSKGTSK